MAVQIKTRKESTGRPCIGDKKLVSVNLYVEEDTKAWLESFGKGNKSKKSREIFQKEREKEKEKEEVKRILKKEKEKGEVKRIKEEREMTEAKKFVLEHYPDAEAFEASDSVHLCGRWAIRIKSIDSEYFAFGERLQSSAWENAKAKILERLEN